MRTQAQKAAAFRALHDRPGAFIIPNPWDAGTARLLASLGFEALATTSLGLANTLGRADGISAVGLDKVIENVRTISEATDLPVNADLENGYADAPERVAETIRRAAKAGAVGASIEDFTGDPQRGIYDFQHALERVQAAVEAAHSLAVPVMLTARAETRAQRSRRYHPTAASVREGRCRCAVCAGASRSPHHPRGGRLCGEAAQCGDQHGGSVDHRRTAGGCRCQTHQRRRCAVAARARCLHGGRAVDGGERLFYLGTEDDTYERAEFCV